MEAIHLIHGLIALCGKGGFALEKWISNSRVVLQAISEEQRAKELKTLDLDIDKLPMERALGLQWCVETDAAFSVDWCIKPADFGPVKQGQLHHFSDASEGGYGTVTYICLMNEEDRIHISFLRGKGRVTYLYLLYTHSPT